MNGSHERRRRGWAAVSTATALALLMACTEPVPDAGSGSATTAPETPQTSANSVAATTAAEAATTAAADTSNADPATTAAVVASTTPAPSGEPFVIGVINTQGAPGLDFPEFTTAFEAAADYVNTELGGFAGRPLELKMCVAAGSPESSQACAEDLTSNGVELAMLGLDLFVAYPTFAAAGIPVYGAVPVFPGDYTADAVYLTAGNLVVMAATANAATNPAFLGAQRVAVLTDDSPASISALGSLEPALTASGAEYTVIKGAINETDAGYLNLMQQAAETDPQAIISLYGESGCVGLMRARAQLEIAAPAFSNTICLSDRVLEAVGPDADGWYFAGANGGEETDDTATMRRYVSAQSGVAAEDVNPFGFTSLGWLQLLSAWQVADGLAAEGTAVTGAEILAAFRDGRGELWATGRPTNCGSVAAYSAVCGFELPFATRVAGATEPAFDEQLVTALDLLPG